MNYTVITGASSGIGKALAYQFAQHNHSLILTARRKNLLDELAEELMQKFSVEVLTTTSDLSNEMDVRKFYQFTKDFYVSCFINNAGLGDFSYPWDTNMDKAKTMMDINIKALAELSLMYVHDYADQESTLLNVSSAAGYNQFSVATLYGATKFFVSALTEGIAGNLLANNKKMKAKVLAPSATNSEFVENGLKSGTIDVMNGAFKSVQFTSAEDVARYGYELYKSDKIVGLIKDHKLQLCDPIFPH